MLRADQVRKLYYGRKLSMWDIAETISTTPATVIYWMKKYNFKRSSSSECAYVKQNPNGDPFKIKTKLTKREGELLLIGLMLY